MNEYQNFGFGWNNYNRDNGTEGIGNDYHDRRKVKSEATINLEMCNTKCEIKSNQVEADIVKIIITEEQSCRYAFEGCENKYIVKIFNDSCVDLCDIDFKDEFSDTAEYEKNSFKVDGRAEDPIVKDHTIKYRIRELKAKEKLIITFDLKLGKCK